MPCEAEQASRDVPDTADPPPQDSGNPLPRLYPVQEAATFFGRTDRTLRTWVRCGHLHPVRVGRSVFFTEAELLRVIHRVSEPPDGPGGPPINTSTDQ